MSDRRERHGVDEYLDQEEMLAPQELVWGYVRDAPSPAPRHQSAVFDFAIAWKEHVEDTGLGCVLIAPMDCVLDRERALVVQPDALFVSRERKHIITDRVWGAPDLVLEVLSPNPRIGTLNERLDWFARYGVRESWLYDQFARELEVVAFANGRLAERSRFEFRDRIVSGVFARFDRSCASIIMPFEF